MRGFTQFGDRAGTPRSGSSLRIISLMCGGYNEGAPRGMRCCARCTGWSRTRHRGVIIDRLEEGLRVPPNVIMWMRAVLARGEELKELPTPE
jgi:hypothetical protein